MKRQIIYIILCLSLHQVCVAQIRLRGKVVSADDRMPLPGAAIKVTGTAIGVSADSLGHFSIVLPDLQRKLSVTYLGFQTGEVSVSMPADNLVIALEPDSRTLKEVIVSTGYQDIAREKATGSFSKIDRKLLDARISTDVLSRIDGLTSNLIFDKRDGLMNNISIRGRSTILSDNSPLIVVDNFPYEGDLDNLNPNDIESITVLKDAAAAAIWGARAGNGVIVIATRRGREGQPAKVDISSNLTIGERPDLFYDPQFLSSADFINVEQQLFARNYYNADEISASRRPLSPVVDLLIAQRKGEMTSAQVEQQINQLRQQDIRRGYEKHVYRNTIRIQNALTISGGGSNNTYYLSAGHDQNNEEAKGLDNRRITLNSFNTFKPVKRLEVGAGLSYNQYNRSLHSFLFNRESTGGGRAALLPYAKLVDENGTPLPMIKDYNAAFASSAESRGLLNWQYVPLEEIQMSNNNARTADVRLNTFVKYQLFEPLNIEARYQYYDLSVDQQQVYDEATYYVRNLVNQYSQTDGTKAIPAGGILNRNLNQTLAHSGRVQLNFNKRWGNDHSLMALIGAEVRQAKGLREGIRLYGYDPEVLTSQPVDYTGIFARNPSGTGRIPNNVISNDEIDRNVSEYVNATYSFRNRYVITGSARRDASNLFGVKTNQRWVPLWSAGLAWTISEEKFFSSDWLPYLKLRASYGHNGNSDKSITAYTTASYSSDNLSGMPNARILSPPNPELRWERVAIFNTGFDFETKARRLSGSLEYFSKIGTDQIGNIPLDPTTGFFLSNRYSTNRNGAKIKGSGFDAEITSRNFIGRFKWETNALFSFVKDEVVSYSFQHPVTSYFVVSTPMEGKPVMGVYSYRFAGLDPATGEPMVYIKGNARKDYSAMNGQRTTDDLVFHGSALPRFSGGLRNTFSWKAWSAGVNLTYKFDYYFRNSTINYNNLFSQWVGHRDFSKRWQKPGDEASTNVPSMPLVANANRDNYYINSDALVERGDHIRIRDISVSYTPDISRYRNLPVKRLNLMLYVNNPGIIWRANRSGIDPDYSLASILPVRTVSMGLKANF